MKGKGAGPGSFRGERGPLPGSPGAGRCVALAPVCPTACRRPPRAPSSPAGPRQRSPHWLHVSLETRQRRCKHRLQNVSFRPAPPPHCHEGSVHLPEASLLAGARPQGDCRSGGLEPQLRPQAPKGGGRAQEAASEGPLPVGLGSGAIAGHQLP